MFAVGAGCVGLAPSERLHLRRTVLVRKLDQVANDNTHVLFRAGDESGALALAAAREEAFAAASLLAGLQLGRLLPAVHHHR